MSSWARSEGIGFSDNVELCSNSAVQTRVMEEVEGLCSGMARFEQIKKIALLDEEFSIEGGELTPTMKVRRREVDEKYARQIEGIYS